MPTKSLLTCLAGAALLLPALATARPAYTVEPTRIHAGPGPDYPLIVVAPPRPRPGGHGLHPRLPVV